VPVVTDLNPGRAGDGLLTEDLLDDLALCAAEADRSGTPDRGAVDRMRAAGLFGLAAPHAYGGREADPVGLNRAIERVARVNASAAIMLFQHFAVTRRIVEQGTPAQHRAFLTKLADGRWLAASAWSETGAGADKRNLSTTAVFASPGRWLLNGAKSFTTSAGLADLYLVLARTGQDASEADEYAYGSAGQTFFLVPADCPGLLPDTSMALAGMRGSATGFVSLADCRVEDAYRLGDLGAAARAIAKVRESGATLGAVAVGVAQAALDTAVGHVRARGLLAEPRIRAQLASLATSVEAARAIVERAGRRDSANPGLTTLHSKLYAAQAAELVTTEAARMLGSSAYIENHPMNRLLRDARAVALMGPTNDLCRELVSSAWM
jgi:alkylation response protein AidB-like acyl-CoA dehydrogenase